MNKFENCHAGAKALVIGNGPSLRDVPRDFLGRQWSFGTNRIYLLDGFNPCYYAACNPLVIEQCQHEINALDCPKFIAAPQAHLIPGSYPLHSGGEPLFGYDPLRPMFEGFTVTFVALQLAFYMGFETVLLVGVDHRYTYEGVPNERQYLTTDPNHFAPDYFKGLFWHTPDLESSRRSYQLAEDAYRADGRIIINLTPNSALDVFEKQDLNKWL